MHIRAHVPPNLLSILISSRFVKAGMDIASTLDTLRDMWTITELYPTIPPDSFINLAELAQLKGCSKTQPKTLAQITALILKHSLNKPYSLQFVPWSSPHIPEEQWRFAALDSYASWQIWSTLSQLPSVGLFLNKQALYPGHLITLYSGKKVVAHGITVTQPKSLPISPNNPQIILNTPSRIVIEVQEVIVPGHINTFHSQTLEALQNLLQPFHIMVSLRCVRTRSNSPSVTPTIAPPASLSQPILHSFAGPSSSIPCNVEEDLEDTSDSGESDSGSELDNSECDLPNMTLVCGPWSCVYNIPF